MAWMDLNAAPVGGDRPYPDLGEVNAYGTVSDIQRMCGDLVRNRLFDDTTSPSLSDVILALGRAAAYLNGQLQSNGYNAPVDSSNSDASAVGWISEVNGALVAARLLNQLIIREAANNEAADGDPDLKRRSNQYENQVTTWIKAVENGRFSGGRPAAASRVAYSIPPTSSRVVSLEMDI